MKQLPLPIRLDQRATFAAFVAGENGMLVEALKGMLNPASKPEPQVYLWSGGPNGKSHLLQSLCQAASEAGTRAIYLPLGEMAESDFGILENLERYAIVCLDDVHRVCGLPEWAEALFHLINRLRQSGSRLAMSANGPPDALDSALPDLASRLSWGPVYRIQPLRDGDLVDFVVRRSRRQGVVIPRDVVEYLIRFTRRDVTEMIEWVDLLDREALARQRRVTRPFIRELVASSGGRRRQATRQGH